MWIKRALILFPLTLVTMIVVASFFVPPVDSLAQNESRRNRIVWTLPSDVQSLNPWFAASTTDSTVYDHIFEGLFESDGDYILRPMLASSVRIGEEFVIVLDPDQDAEAFKALLSEKMAEVYPETFDKVTDYDWRDYDSNDNGYFINRKYSESEWPEGVTRATPSIETVAAAGCGVDGIRRVVVHFRPDPSVEYGADAMPNAIQADAPKQLDVIMALSAAPEGAPTAMIERLTESFGGDYVSNFDSKELAIGWYCKLHGLDEIASKLSMPPPIRDFAISKSGLSKPEDEKDGEFKELEYFNKAYEAAKPQFQGSNRAAITSMEEFVAARALYSKVATSFRLLIQRLRNPQGVKGESAANEEVLSNTSTLNLWHMHLDRARSAVLADAFKDTKDKVGEGIEPSDALKLDFDAFLAQAPKQRYEENPAVHFTIHEDVKWQDWGKVEPAFDEWGMPIMNEDGTQKTVKIQETLDVEDIAFTFKFGRDPKNASIRKSAADSIRQFRLYDRHTMTATYGELYSPALSDLGMPVLPAHRFSQSRWLAEARKRGIGPKNQGKPEPGYDVAKALSAKDLEFSLDPIGTGPLKLYPLNGERGLPRWRSGELLRLQRFDEHWNKARLPRYEYMDFYVFDPDMGQETADLTFRSGGTDVYSVRSEQVEEYSKETDRFYLHKRLALSYEYIAFNLGRKPYDDIRVRQALTMAINVEEIIKYVVRDQGRRINGPGYPLLDWYNPDFVPNYTFLQGENAGRSLREMHAEATEAGDEEAARVFQYFPYDPAESKALLLAAGFREEDGKLMTPDGERFKIELALGSNISSSRGKIATLAQQEWKKLGIEVVLKELEWNVFIQEYALQRNFDALVLGWNGGTDFDSRQLWHSEFLSPGAGLNFVEYKNPEVDALFERILKVYDVEEQIRLSHEIFDRIAEDSPYIFLFSPYANVAINRDIFWNAPVEKDGKITYEARSVLDPRAMNVKRGPAAWEFRSQWERAPEAKFKDHKGELRIVRSPEVKKALEALEENK